MLESDRFLVESKLKLGGRHLKAGGGGNCAASPNLQGPQQMWCCGGEGWFAAAAVSKVAVEVKWSSSWEPGGCGVELMQRETNEGQEVVGDGGVGGVKLGARNKEREGGLDLYPFVSETWESTLVGLSHPPTSRRRGPLMVPRNHIGPLVASHRIEPLADLIGGDTVNGLQSSCRGSFRGGGRRMNQRIARLSKNPIVAVELWLEEDMELEDLTNKSTVPKGIFESHFGVLELWEFWGLCWGCFLAAVDATTEWTREFRIPSRPARRIG